MARVRAVSSHRVALLTEGWELAALDPDQARDPDALGATSVAWVPAPVPGTAASALRATGQWDFDRGRDFDVVDWWYRCRFEANPGPSTVLRLEGLATLAEVWLNGSSLLRSDDMFRAHALDVALLPRNELLIRFRALGPELKARRPRPRWRTRLVASQQMRFVRTTLLGRMPGWCPPVAPVGPWRPVRLEERAALAVEEADLRTEVVEGRGHVRAALRVRSLGGASPTAAVLVAGDVRSALDCQPAEGGDVVLRGQLTLPDVQLWWPHTHGSQPLYAVKVRVSVGEREVEIDCGRVGFRSLEVEPGSGFGLRVNGVPVFCRGACWTPLDVVTLTGSPEDYRAALVSAQEAGMNMIRIGGTMVYEADAFYDLCDELGLLVWQDFMFANMDYPFADAAFLTAVEREVDEILDRLQSHPCLAVLCGNSEVAQQAAMLGLPRAVWGDSFFEELLPARCRASRPDVPYCPSSPSGGSLPFQVDQGVGHYYGVGAYLRPLEDARRAGVRFASECLGFSNVPELGILDQAFEPSEAVVHHPRWKARVPRDVGAGWDFEDVRDHYLARVFGVDPGALRYSDHERYLELSRVVTGEVMAAVFTEWRRAGSTCRGGLVWLYRDLWPGAGWGVLDSSGGPKAAYYFLKRVLATVVLLPSDEGLNGLYLHAVNETSERLEAELGIRLYRHDVCVGKTTTAAFLPPRGEAVIHVDALFPGFLDLTRAYRFGPPGHHLLVASLTDRTSGNRLAEAFHFPGGLPSGRELDLGLEALAGPHPDGGYALRVRTPRFAQSVAIDAAGFRPEDNYFHLEAGAERTIRLHGDGVLRGTVRALNAHTAARIAAHDAAAQT